jgi:ATP-dependent RNA helicase DOB1
MDPTDLFSFLEQAPDVLEKDLDEVDMADVPTRKRKANTSIEEPVQNGESLHSDENGVGSSSHKKQRFASPAPIVLDEVEVEARREVKASAGLMGAEGDEAGSRLELKHQARHLVSISRL